MPVNHQWIVLDQRTQKRNPKEDVLPFHCYDGDNTMNKKTIAVRVWTGMGINIYSGAGYVQVKGNSESMDEDHQMKFSEVMKKAYQFNFANDEGRG